MITTYNANSNNFTIKYLKRATNGWVSNILSKDLMHVRCYVYIVNFIVCARLKNIWNVGSFVRFSPRQLVFNKMLMLLIQWW